jgi:D-alanyl-lipoteichoic acid acyltransferase DltB (MBOAT superfamily)
LAPRRIQIVLALEVTTSGRSTNGAARNAPADPRDEHFEPAVALNLAVLCYFKYTGFILDGVSALSGLQLPFVNIILPLGISFFTFQQIAYLVDVIRGAKVQRDIVGYTLFVSFFPHLIAGMI